MSSFAGKLIQDERLKSSQLDEIILTFKITGAKTAVQVTKQGAPVIVGFDTGDFTQAAADALSVTGSSGITVATSFGSTAMGTNAFGFIIGHGGVKAVSSLVARSYQTAGGTPENNFVIVEGAGSSLTALPDTLVANCATTSSGMIYGKVILGNLDSVTAGFVELRIRVVA